MNLLPRPARRVLAGIAVAFAAAAVMLLSGGPSYGSDPVQRGAACSHTGAVAKNRQGVEYICEQRAGDDCPRWHAHRPQPGPWPSRSTLPCNCTPSKPAPSTPTTSTVTPSTPPATSSPTAHATPPVTPTAPPTAAGHPTPQPTLAPAAQTLPITGESDALPLIGVALALIGAGGLLAVIGHRRVRPAEEKAETA